MKDQSGRLTGYGIHDDRRTKRMKTRQAQEDQDIDPPCDKCGKRNAKMSGGWQMLCMECRKEEENQDDDYDEYMG